MWRYQGSSEFTRSGDLFRSRDTVLSVWRSVWCWHHVYDMQSYDAHMIGRAHIGAPKPLYYKRAPWFSSAGDIQLVTAEFEVFSSNFPHLLVYTGVPASYLYMLWQRV